MTSNDANQEANNEANNEDLESPKTQASKEASGSKTLGKKLKGRLKKQLNKGLPKTILGQKVPERISARINQSAQIAAEIAGDTVQMATETAKHGLDQVLINLEHRGIIIKDSTDLAQKVGRKVLERAEAIRAQIAENPFSPAWLKDVSLAPQTKTTAATAEPAKKSETAEQMSFSTEEATVAVVDGTVDTDTDVNAEEAETATESTISDAVANALPPKMNKAKKAKSAKAKSMSAPRTSAKA